MNETKRKKTFIYYNDINENKLYVTRDIYEACQNNNINFESTPKIINNRNCYSITIEAINELCEKANYNCIDKKITKKKNSNNIIVYKEKNTNNIYIPETKEIYIKDKKTKNILNKKCYKITERELEKIYNKDIIITTVYTKPYDKEEIILCNINNSNYIQESIINKYSINIYNRKRIRVDGSIYIEILDKELNHIKNLGNQEEHNIIFTTKNIYPVNN